MANIKKKPKAQSKVVDDAVKRFSDMLIKRMEEMQRDWTKPWIGGGIVNGLPQNVSGWTYTGSNAFLLFLHSSEKNYKAPVYMTPGQTHNLGAKIHKGEKAVPVFKFGISVRDKNGNKLTEDEYDNLSDSEKKECHRRPFIRVYPEFNIDQTNLAEVNKEKYDAILSRFKIEEVPQKTDGMYVNKALDRMLEKQEWVCPIQYDKESKGAYYSPGKDIVVLPTKAQFHKHMDDPEESFKDGQAFYGTALHEMAHSTGHPSRLDRLKPSVFGSPEYAKEELVAELTSAMVGNSLGFDRRISDNNVAYLQNWTAALRQEPKFLVSVMADVNKASKMLIENIDKQRVALGEKPLIQGTLDGVEEKVKNEQQLDEIKAEQEKEDPKEAVAKEWASLDEKPTVEMESGDVLPVSYNKEKDTLEVLITKEDGTQEVHSTNYDHDRDIAGNLGYVWEELSNMKQYQAKQEVKQEEQVKPEPYVDDPKVNSVIEQIAKLPEMPKYNAGELGEFSIQYNSVNNTLVGGNRGMYEGVTIDYDYDKSYQENVDALVSKLDNTDLKEYFKEENFRNQVADEMGKLDMDAKSYNTGKYPAIIDYDKETDKLNLHFVTPEGELDKGMPVIMSTDYKHSLDVQSNISKFEQYLDKQNVDSVIENTVLEDYAKGVKENPGMKEFLDGQKTEGDLLNSKVYFTTLMTTLNDGQHEGHTALDIKNMSELRDYFKENPHVSEWVAQASDKELIEAGADMLPNIRYSHKEGRTLYDMEAAYSNINAKYEDVTDDRTRQIAHRIDQAKSIVTAYHNNIEETKGEDYLFKEDSAHKMIPREDYAKSVSQTQTVEPTQENMDKKEMYYFSHTYLQSTDSCEELDNLVEKKDYDSLLYLTKEYDQGDALEQRNTYKNAKKFSGDDILAEDDNYAVVYNSSVGGTYDLMRKVTKEDIIDNIERYGLDSDATEDVKKVAYENVAKQFSEIKNKIPAFTMPNEDVVYFQYNQEKNQIEVGGVTNIGLSVQHRFDYDVDRTLDANLENVYEQLSELPEYQMVEEDDLSEGQEEETAEKEEQEVKKEEQSKPEPYDEDPKVNSVIEQIANLKEMPEYDAGELGKFSIQYNPLEHTLVGGNRGIFEGVTIDYDYEKSYQENVDALVEKLDNTDLKEYFKEENFRNQVADKFGKMDNDSKTYDTGTLSSIIGYDKDADKLTLNFVTPEGDLDTGMPDILSMDYKHSLGVQENINKFEEYLDTQDVDNRIAKIMSDDYAKGLKEDPSMQEFIDGKETEEQKNAVPHEDSNIQTDVAGLANDFAEEGKPMEQAEKEAKAVVDDKQHEAYHEDEAKKQEQTKAAQEKEAEAKAAKEKAEKEKQQQEAKKEENKPSKEVAHAAILLGALAAAKENNGVWMNKEGKSNAEFMFSHTPVTAYNNIMMNLVSDQKGYRTNVFTYYDKAQMNGVAIKQGEQATKFNWTQWDYQNLTNKDDIISSKKYESLSDDEKKMYGKHASRLAQNIYNIDQTTYPAVGGDKFIELLKEKGAQQEDMKPTTASSYLKQYDELKAKHPDVVVLLRNNDSYEIYKSDAKKASEATRLPIIKKEIDGKKIDTVSFPHTLLDRHLPNIIRAGHRIAICDQLENPKLVKSVPDGQEVIKKANAVAKAVAKQSGIEYKRVMVVQDAKYDKAENKIIVSGMSGNHVGSERIAALQKANDIYRAVVASTGTENRLDRSGRNSLLPEDDAKHEKLVQELAAGVLMARQGLPATMSKESQKLIPYWEREFKENPKMVGVIERDVNNAVETIDNLVAKREVNYQAIRGQLPPKMITDKTENYSIASDLAKLPSIDTKEIVVVKNVLEKEADVILPAGASLDPKNEVPGMRKDRITHALNKEGYDEVRFYNAGGSLGLNKPNSYFESRDVSLNQLKQYQLINHKTIDVTQQAKQENKVEIEKFQAIRDDRGRWAFYIKPKNEPQFSVYPTKEHMNTYWRVRNTPEKKATHDVLAQKWYEVAKQHPEIKVDLITPRPAKDIDMSRIVNPTITKSAQDNNVKLAFATIDGVRQRATINETQWNRMWLADDKAEYKKAVAAVVFEPILKKGVEQQQTEAVKETEKVEVKDAPEPVKKQEEHEEQNHSRGMHI